MPTDFKHKSITTPDLVNYINKQSGQDFTYLFEQYLYRIEIPGLELRIKEKGNKFDYRWQNVKDDFAMPVRITIAKDKLDFIYPGTSWKNIEVENLLMNDFKVESNRLIKSSVVRNK